MQEQSSRVQGGEHAPSHRNYECPLPGCDEKSEQQTAQPQCPSHERPMALRLGDE